MLQFHEMKILIYNNMVLYLAFIDILTLKNLSLKLISGLIIMALDNTKIKSKPTLEAVLALQTGRKQPGSN